MRSESEQEGVCKVICFNLPTFLFVGDASLRSGGRRALVAWRRRRPPTPTHDASATNGADKTPHGQTLLRKNTHTHSVRSPRKEKLRRLARVLLHL